MDILLLLIYILIIILLIILILLGIKSIITVNNINDLILDFKEKSASCNNFFEIVDRIGFSLKTVHINLLSKIGKIFKWK